MERKLISGIERKLVYLRKQKAFGSVGCMHVGSKTFEKSTTVQKIKAEIFAEIAAGDWLQV